MTSTLLDQYVYSYTSRDLLRDVWRFLKPYRGKFTLASLLRLSGDLAGLYSSFAFASIVTFLSRYQPGGSFTPFWTVIILWFFSILWRHCAIWAAKYVGFQLAERLALDAKVAGTRHLLRLDLDWHERENIGNKVKRIERGGDSLNQIIRFWISNIIEIIVNFVGVFLIVSSQNTGVAIMFVVFVIGFLFISRQIGKYAVAAAHVVNAKEEDVGGLIFQAAQNIRTVKALGAIATIMRYLQDVVDSLLASLRRRIFFFQTRSVAVALFGATVRISTLAFIGYGITQGRFELGFLVLFNGYFNNVWMSAEELSNVSQDFVVARQSVARLSNLLSEPLGIETTAGKSLFPKHWKEMRFASVDFSYGSQDVLSSINLTIRRGERLGLIGLSGAGKSTIMKLLLKEYEPTSGRLMVDGLDLATINRDSYLKQVAVVLQETEVFNFSLKDNVVIADDGQINEDRFSKALAVAHVNEFLPKLPQGVDSLIGEKGVKLSGGEKQRLGLARAIYKQPEILLLDEATSHLDLESEEKIQDALHQVFQNVTAVVIAHRLTTIREMDRIVVLEDGKIIEIGSFDELMKKRGRFAELWDKQRL